MVLNFGRNIFAQMEGSKVNDLGLKMLKALSRNVFLYRVILEVYMYPVELI